MLPPTLIEIPAGNSTLRGMFFMPASARSIIVFAHGLASSCLNPRNRLAARSLLQRGFAILQPDPVDLTGDSADSTPLNDREELLHSAKRLIVMIDWLTDNPATRGLQISLYGACAGAAAAMIAAARRPAQVHAVVSRGCRPDLMAELLPEVQPEAPVKRPCHSHSLGWLLS